MHLTSVYVLFKGNYSDSLSDAQVATELQPTYLRAIVIGRVGAFLSSFLKIP